MVTAAAGALIISGYASNSSKQVNASARVRFTYIILVPLAFIFIFLHLPISLLGIFGLYGLSAPSLWAYRKLRRRNRPVAQTLNKRPAPRIPRLLGAGSLCFARQGIPTGRVGTAHCG